MDHEASYIMTRATVVAEVAHRGQVGIRASVVSHINMSSHGGDGWEEMTCTALYTEVVVVGSNKEILVGGVGRKQKSGLSYRVLEGGWRWLWTL